MRVRCCGQAVGEETGKCKLRETGCWCGNKRCGGFPLMYFKSMPKQTKKEK